MSICRKSRKWKLILLLFTLFMCCKLYSYLTLWSDLTSLTEVEKCPVCFGVSLCSAITKGHVSIGGFNTIFNLLNLIGSKNVLFGFFGDTKVVIKKLGSDWELKKLDSISCGNAAYCNESELATHFRNEAINNLKQMDLANANNNFYLCPSTTNVDRLLSVVLNKNTDVNPDELYMNIWTLMLHNGEPLILQILDEKDGWPVPKYYGACGRLVVEEYVGEMLSSYLHSSWYTRAQLSFQLLVAARDFTNKHPHFRFYLTDISMDNIAVDRSGNVKFIDVEDVIIVDRDVPKEERPESWNLFHASEKFEEERYLAYSVDDICNHHKSDHNYFGICQQLLAFDDGLLSGIPQEVLKLYPKLPSLIEECVYPTGNAGRYAVAHQLMTILVNITENVKTEL